MSASSFIVHPEQGYNVSSAQIEADGEDSTTKMGKDQTTKKSEQYIFRYYRILCLAVRLLFVKAMK